MKEVGINLHHLYQQNQTPLIHIHPDSAAEHNETEETKSGTIDVEEVRTLSVNQNYNQKGSMVVEHSLQMNDILSKWSPALLKGWQSRRVLLKNRKIKWYLVSGDDKQEMAQKDTKEEGLDAFRGIINFDLF